METLLLIKTNNKHLSAIIANLTLCLDMSYQVGVSDSKINHCARRKVKVNTVRTYVVVPIRRHHRPHTTAIATRKSEWFRRSLRPR